MEVIFDHRMVKAFQIWRAESLNATKSNFPPNKGFLPKTSQTSGIQVSVHYQW